MLFLSEDPNVHILERVLPGKSTLLFHLCLECSVKINTQTYKNLPILKLKLDKREEIRGLIGVELI